MAAPVVELRNAIADYIENQTYSFTFNLQKGNFFNSDLAKTRTTNVYVYPAQELGSATAVYTRDTFTRRYTISVHITNYIDDFNSDAEIDNALLLVHEIERSLENKSFGDFEMVAFESELSGRPFFEQEQVQQRSYFHVILNIGYEGVTP